MPVLETQRLLMRPIAISDLEVVHRLHTDPLVVQSLFSGEPPARPDTQEKVELYVRSWQQNGFGFFSVFVKGNSPDHSRIRRSRGLAGASRTRTMSNTAFAFSGIWPVAGSALNSGERFCAMHSKNSVSIRWSH
ncbi:GNAT family N-acetyltransferase [Mesorhizobium atlanticum]